MAELFATELCGPQDRDIDVIFIHGLSGNHKTTWQRDKNDEASFWPKWLSDDHQYCRVICIDYPADAVLWLSSGADMTIVDRAPSLVDYLLTFKVGEKPIVFVTHSLGGLIAKQILRVCASSPNPRWKNICQSTWGVVFLGTPHVGSKLSNFASLVPGIRPSDTTKQLEWAEEKLRDLGQWYSDQAPQLGYQTKAYCEKIKSKIGFLIVDEVSANPGVYGCNVIAVDEDHSGICKPPSKTAAVYRGVSDFIGECHVASAKRRALQADVDEQAENLSEEYEQLKSKKPGDRLDLSEKLNLGNRSHEVEDALRKKEQFAIKFQRRGLQSTAVRRYVRALNDVEALFNRHIYPLIVADQDQVTVNTALQLHVVKPVLDSHNGGDDVINQASIDKMIYYLTGQCYIRWHHD